VVQAQIKLYPMVFEAIAKLPPSFSSRYFVDHPIVLFACFMEAIFVQLWIGFNSG